MLEITAPVPRIRVLAAVAEAEGATSLDLAFAALARIDAEAARVTDPVTRTRVSLTLAGTLAALTPVDTAIGVARTIDRRAERIRVLGSIAVALDRAGLRRRAVAVMNSIVDGCSDHQERWYLIGALVPIGLYDRAFATVRDAPDRDRNSLGGGLVRALAAAGEFDRALAAAAEMDPGNGRDVALVHVVAALAEAGEPDRALDVARNRISAPRERSSGLRRAAAALHRAGRTAQAMTVLRSVLETARDITNPSIWVQETHAAAEALIALGDRETGLAAIRGAGVDREQIYALAAVAAAMVAAGDRDSAVDVLESAPLPAEPEYGRETHSPVTVGLVAAGRPDRAIAVAAALASRLPRAQALITVASAIAGTGATVLANEVLDRVDAALQVDDPDPYHHSYLLVWVAQARNRAGRPDLAAALLADAELSIMDIGDPDPEYSLWLLVVAALVDAGELTRAEAVARANGVERALVTALIGAGALDRAEAAARGMTDLGARSWALSRVAIAHLTTGSIERGVGLIDAVTRPADRADALITMARAQIDAGRRDEAAQTLRRAATVARESPGPDPLTVRIVEATLALGGLDRAADLLRDAEAATADRPDVLVDVWCARGRLDRAELAAHEVTDPLERSRALARVVAGYRAMRRAHEARAVVEQAAIAAGSVREPDRQAIAWAHVAVAWAVTGRGHWAVDIIERTADAVPGLPAVTAELVRALVGIGEHTKARAMAAVGGDPAVVASERAALAAALARAGDIDQALATARSVTDADLCEHALAEVAVVLARTGNPHGALALLA